MPIPHSHVRSWIAPLAWCLFLTSGFSCSSIHAQDAADATAQAEPSDKPSDEPKTKAPDETKVAVPSAEIDGTQPQVAKPTSVVHDHDKTDKKELTPEKKAAANKEYEAELAKRVYVFRVAKSEMVETMGELREIMIRYVNREARSPQAIRDHATKRAEVRKNLNKTYDTALNVLRIGLDDDAARFVLTMVQHRLANSIYDLETAEGAARLIDAGNNLMFLYLCGARSAVVAGEFDMAKRLYDVITEEELRDTDRGLKFTLEKSKLDYLKEMELRERDDASGDLPRVKIETTQGDIIVELFLKEAPSTVSHFLGLVKEGFYDEVDFHQVIKDLLALTGDPSGLGDNGCGKYLIDEHEREDARAGLRGSLVMAKRPRENTGTFYPNSASSQFAFLFLPVAGVSKQQTIFGRVIEGMEVVTRLRRVDASEKKDKKELQVPPDRIISATILRAPKELPEPKYFDIQAAMQLRLQQQHHHQNGSHHHPSESEDELESKPQDQ